ncbi:conserved membrane hypothetical protein [Arthrobacter sp. 9AX]|uniref:hypothetical protein n=1 Tax=Arthrobacter sp. 9AX TaxID=2653131 RepID=UPI0012F0A953|nr:hypothetical protein [Arthrobacter sp. 9AX]VXC22056.1 conserved membrane hypothetical protein [Arthrobacter sp. 9AX]
MEQLIPWLVFCAAFLLFSLVRPYGARIFIGIFFIVMALGVNALLSFIAPELFVSLGTDKPLIPFYAWIFENVVAAAPPVVGIVAAAGEITVGLLILSRGRRVKLGLIGAIVFLLIITPLGVWTLPNPLMAAGLARLLTKEFPHALWDRRVRGASR